MVSLSRKAVVTTAFLLFVVVGSAVGAPREPATQVAPWATDGGATSPAFSVPLERSSFAPGAQHGATNLHLPAVRENVDLISKSC